MTSPMDIFRHRILRWMFYVNIGVYILLVEGTWLKTPESVHHPEQPDTELVLLQNSNPEFPASQGASSHNFRTSRSSPDYLSDTRLHRYRSDLKFESTILWSSCEPTIGQPAIIRILHKNNAWHQSSEDDPPHLT